MGHVYRCGFALMTSRAKLFPLFGQEEGILRGMVIVAGIALSLFKRWVLYVTAVIFAFHVIFPFVLTNLFLHGL